MHTGDLAVMREDGYVQIVGRIKDMIIRGGENVYPREVEEFLYSHPKIADVQVVGVPDATYGEEILACVIPSDPADPPTLDELTAYCREQLAHYKIPRRIADPGDLPDDGQREGPEDRTAGGLRGVGPRRPGRRQAASMMSPVTPRVAAAHSISSTS